MKSLSIGESLVDIFVNFNDEKIVHVIGGAPLNCAVVYALDKDNESTLITDFGSDFHGNEINKFLASLKVKVINKVNKNFTTKAIVKKNKDKSVEFKFIYKDDNDSAYKHNIKVDEYDLINFVSAFYLSDDNLYTKIYSPLLKSAIKENKKIVFDPNYRDDAWGGKSSFFQRSLDFIKNADLIKLKDSDLQILQEQASLLGIDKDIKKFIKKNSVLINTKSNKDIEIYYNDQNFYFKNEIEERIIDSAGAGDILLSSISNKFFKEKKVSIDKIVEFTKDALVEVKQSLSSVGAIGFLEQASWIDNKIQF
ncbi:fructokinase [Spiroplasma chinense]|uniref:Fructokinase n=1 Tax=Spiroplasma chinense TaxID=216932 RepID=A0A5B9Y7G9_9MOLU|nr:PfkB family carbohydrate kinase [Spiroplasma chinense]QEH62267.1 fructokinase [Spiroplasma chinense]